MTGKTITTYTVRLSKLPIEELDLALTKLMHKAKYLHEREKLEHRVDYRLQHPDTLKELIGIRLAEHYLNLTEIGIKDAVYSTRISYGISPGVEYIFLPPEEQKFVDDTRSRIADELAQIEDPEQYWAPKNRLSYFDVKAVVERTLLEFTTGNLSRFERYRCETTQIGDAYAYTLYCYFEDIEFPFARFSVYPVGNSWGMSESKLESEEPRLQLLERLMQRLEHMPYHQRPRSYQIPEFSDKINALSRSIHENLGVAAKHKSPNTKKSKRGKSRYSEAVMKKAVLDWEAIDTKIDPITLDEFLEQRFGTEGGILKVSPSTFYSWRKKYR